MNTATYEPWQCDRRAENERMIVQPAKTGELVRENPSLLLNGSGIKEYRAISKPNAKVPRSRLRTLLKKPTPLVIPNISFDVNKEYMNSYTQPVTRDAAKPNPIPIRTV
jgi:hypothetical protein